MHPNRGLRAVSCALCVALMSVTGARAAVILEVNVEGTFTPIAKSIVPSPRPQIRVTLTAGEELNALVVYREDNRAGYGGGGKFILPCPGSPALDCRSESGGVHQAVVESGIGRVRIEAQTSAGLFDETMLTYSRAYEDLNGDGVLNGVDEDLDENGFLDPGEDGNNNRLLDFPEDVNGNGTLDVKEDLDNDGQLDMGEDLNANGSLDTSVSLTVNYPVDTSVTVQHPEGFSEHATTVILGFVSGVSPLTVGNYLRSVGGNPDIEPVGLFVDDITGTRSFYVTARIADGTPPHEVARVLNGQASGDYSFPPPSPPPLPLAEAMVDPISAPNATVAGERMPVRLVNGEEPNAAQGYESTFFKGGFDDSGTSPDELDVAWIHFLTQTYAAHRLMDYLPFRATPRAVSVVDTGFGNGSADNFLPDIPELRITGGRDMARGGADGVEAKKLKDIRDNSATNSHGTRVAEICLGDGTQFVLGTGRRSTLRPIRANYDGNGLRDSLLVALKHNETSVINWSIGFKEEEPPVGNAARFRRVMEEQAILRPAIVLAREKGKIIVAAAGNEVRDVGFMYPRALTVPRRDGTAVDDNNNGTPDDGDYGVDPPESPQVIAVGATGLVGLTDDDNPYSAEGAEHAATSFASTGARLTMCAPARWIRGLDCDFSPPRGYEFSDPFSGTSFAAPQVSGAIIELINVAEATPFYNCAASEAARASCNQRVADMVVATGDDLGTTVVTPEVDRVNDAAGNGSILDDNFGFGRLNVWKATLSVANKGLAAQHGRTTGQNGGDSVFKRLPLLSDAQTEWYGFEIITSYRHATVWIDGVLLEDVGPDGVPGGTDDTVMPIQPEILAYKGVRSEARMERGVHTEFDGHTADPVVGTVPGLVVEENPLTGIVPLGTRREHLGQFVMTFSIKRSDLYHANNTPKVLSLRRRFAEVAEKPFFNLRLNTAEMRTGRVSGVVFDDFVYQVTVSDYGDANLPPTKRSANGARHNDSSLEWLGKLGATNVASVTAEHNSEVEPQGGDATQDVDGVVNRTPGDFHDRDGRDDGVIFFPLTYKPGAGRPGRVRFTIGVHDASSPRYSGSPAQVDKQLYVNLWIDWNTDGVWAESTEHPLNGVRIFPGTWTVVNNGSGGSITSRLISAGDHAEFESEIPVPAVGNGLLWARMRLDYGENVGRNDPRPWFRSLPSLSPVGSATGLVYGAARFGEVEDYLIGTDLGDAADTQCSIGTPPMPNTYPTCLVHDGARHLDIQKEWLGGDDAVKPNATREIDANDKRPPGTDEDPEANLKPEQTDLKDNGVGIPTLSPGQRVDFTIRVTTSIGELGGSSGIPQANPRVVGLPEDDADSLPRYGGTDRRRIYIAGWADWDGSGSWEAAEKIIDDEQDPTTWGADVPPKYTLGEPFVDTNHNGVYDAGEAHTEQFGKGTKDFTYGVDVPLTLPQRFSLRFRVAYGEDENETIPLGVREADQLGRLNSEEKGGALMGEVEDYVWSHGGPATVPAYFTGKVTPDASAIVLSWSEPPCPAVTYHIVYGGASQLPAATAEPYPLLGASCATGPPPVLWSTPSTSLDPNNLIWFLIVADNGFQTEGSWGADSSGSERNGFGPSGSSDLCTADKNPISACAP